MVENERKGDNTGDSGGKSFDSAQDRRPKKLRVLLRTFGCQMNVRDSEVVCGLLRAMSYELTANPEQADVVIFNTCSVRRHAEEKIWSEIGRYANSGKKIIGVIGCMAQNYKEKIFERAPSVDFVVGPSDIHKIPDILNKLLTTDHRPSTQSLLELKIWETDGQLRPEEIYHTGFYEDKNHSYVVISEGCANFCSYCVVPYVRGPLRSRNHQDILREIEEGVDKGITHFTLLGQNVNAYISSECTVDSVQYEEEREKQSSFIDLIRSVNGIKGLKEFSFITSHPKDTTLGLFKAMADLEKLKKYLHLPVQSGSDRILALMNRGYTRKFYLDLASNYRKIVKGGALTTDIIVGFPSESEEEFQDTRDLVNSIAFEAAFIFKYSPRPHTEAQKFPDDVAQEEKKTRHKIILDLQKQISIKRKVASEKCKIKV